MTDKIIIDNFTAISGYGFLSNFHASTIYVDGQAYPTIEHAIQSHKTCDLINRDLIRRSPTPAVAKKLGRAVILRSDWDEVKVDLMNGFVKKKFENPFLGPLLLSTKDADLIFRNTRNDVFWGVCRGKGLNFLGKILMKVREDLKQEDKNTVQIFTKENQNIPGDNENGHRTETNHSDEKRPWNEKGVHCSSGSQGVV